jgi:hypothetical protein
MKIGGWTTEEDFVAGERCTEEQMQSFIRESDNPIHYYSL